MSLLFSPSQRRLILWVVDQNCDQTSVRVTLDSNVVIMATVFLCTKNTAIIMLTIKNTCLASITLHIRHEYVWYFWCLAEITLRSKYRSSVLKTKHPADDFCIVITKRARFTNSFPVTKTTAYFNSSTVVPRWILPAHQTDWCGAQFWKKRTSLVNPLAFSKCSWLNLGKYHPLLKMDKTAVFQRLRLGFIGGQNWKLRIYITEWLYQNYRWNKTW